MIQNRLWRSNPQAMASLNRKEPPDGLDCANRDVDADTWLTPLWLLRELGKFDLDPCAAIVNPHHVCARIYTIADNGLTLPWNGRVFMNPPFSNTAQWLMKHAEHGNGISLVPATVESNVWREYVWPRARALFLLHGRTRFLNPDGSTTTGRPLRSIALIAWTDFDADVLKRSPFAGIFLDAWQRR